MGCNIDYICIGFIRKKNKMKEGVEEMSKGVFEFKTEKCSMVYGKLFGNTFNDQCMNWKCLSEEIVRDLAIDVRLVNFDEVEVIVYEKKFRDMELFLSQYLTEIHKKDFNAVVVTSNKKPCHGYIDLMEG